MTYVLDQEDVTLNASGVWLSDWYPTDGAREVRVYFMIDTIVEGNEVSVVVVEAPNSDGSGGPVTLVTPTAATYPLSGASSDAAYVGVFLPTLRYFQVQVGSNYESGTATGKITLRVDS